ncbi:MAG: PA2169 family four-helix-bundle protein [Parvibaculum sp.]|uniref:PA2169 family four-helix-bundle protein n=1 Tax=Parvibaculum sp. TaxID=2024848 RepID=UPI0025EF45CE|nr:PA2169 family four-helix-bundle protein [Parvibaculum sp.]MCE9649610.1 PA2169 family four-helix-bundle protein [Parvibaculum sp.]
MSTEIKHDIKVLNSLIATALDSAHGYQDAGKEAKNASFKALFERRGMERKQLTAELQGEVRKLGGEPEDEGTALASAHRVFLNLKNSLTGDDQSVINEVERGEDHIKAKFEEALKDSTLSAPVKQTLTTCYASVKAGHDQVSALKHAMKKAS